MYHIPLTLDQLQHLGCLAGCLPQRNLAMRHPYSDFFGCQVPESSAVSDTGEEQWYHLLADRLCIWCGEHLLKLQPRVQINLSY